MLPYPNVILKHFMPRDVINRSDVLDV